MMIFLAKKRGLSLVEAAIVLAVAGVIVGGVFVLADRARDNANVFRMEQLVMETVENIRQGMMAQSNFGTPSFTDLVRRGMIPDEMIVDPACKPAGAGNCTSAHYWWTGSGNGVEIQALDVPASCRTSTQGAARGVQLRLRNMPAKICRQLPTRFAAAADDIKYFCARVGGTDWLPSQDMRDLHEACGNNPIDVSLVFGLRP